VTAALTVTLPGGVVMPMLGLGVFGLGQDHTVEAVERAIELGYRAIDTASIYGNEAAVAEGVRRSGIPRSELFLTTKLWNDAHRRSAATRAFESSLAALGTDYVDLYLIHWPVSGQGLFLEAWESLEGFADSGRARAIGVSNFSPPQLAEIIDLGGRIPAVNQIELHPFHARRSEQELDRALGVLLQAWSPFARGAVFRDPALRSAAAERGVTVAALVLRWLIDLGIPAVPRSWHPGRLAQNLDAENLELLPFERDLLDSLDTGTLVAPEYYANA
jgi:2,5-diketo-D-gluconate reductase A